MLRTLCKSKLHRATVTEANLNYVGSITISRDLMDAADLWAYERVQIVNCNNGARLETYVIEGEPGQGHICLNGAAARLVQPGDKVIIISYAQYEPSELREGHEPKVVFLNERNEVCHKTDLEPPGTTPEELFQGLPMA